MIKKLVLGLVFAGLIGLLIFGVVNRTLARWDETGAGYGVGGQRHGQGAGLGPSDAPSGNDPRDGQGGRQGGRGGGQGYGGGGRRGQGGGAAEQGPRGGSQPGLTAEWLTLSGTVTGVDADGLAVQTAYGRSVEVTNRAWWYAQAQGFAAAVGDAIRMVGFHDGDRFEAANITNTTSGAGVTLRDETGRPMWAGRGNW